MRINPCVIGHDQSVLTVEFTSLSTHYRQYFASDQSLLDLFLIC